MTKTKPDDLDADRATYSWEAYQGLLLLDEASDDSLSAADERGLIEQHAHGGRRWWMRTDQGIRCLARLQEMAEELRECDAVHLAWVARETPLLHDPTSSSKPPFRGLIDVVTKMTASDGGPQWHVEATPLGRAVLWVHEHGEST